ncbi:MAG TPA: RNA 2',3'-cyclic phosphodiesterase [candidate division Zixibacteria bacterium]|nr:RNA 2',3'-cyclic phosphodiesterase [candidate division Zixibacteria bacterium]
MPAATASPARWRLFAAVPVPVELRAAVARAVEGLRGRPGADDDWRWTDADGWHLTLAFLGSTDPARVPALQAALAGAVAGFEPFVADAGGLGAFPSLHRARVLWYGVADPERRLRALAAGVRDALDGDPGPFHAHLTIARSRERFGTDAGPLLRDAAAPGGRLPVDVVVLYRSHLGRGPARYEALFEAPLGVAASSTTGSPA